MFAALAAEDGFNFELSIDVTGRLPAGIAC
jgi:hypothetical protein